MLLTTDNNKNRKQNSWSYVEKEKGGKKAPNVLPASLKKAKHHKHIESPEMSPPSDLYETLKGKK